MDTYLLTVNLLCNSPFTVLYSKILPTAVPRANKSTWSPVPKASDFLFFLWGLSWKKKTQCFYVAFQTRIHHQCIDTNAYCLATPTFQKGHDLRWCLLQTQMTTTAREAGNALASSHTCCPLEGRWKPAQLCGPDGPVTGPNSPLTLTNPGKSRLPWEIRTQASSPACWLLPQNPNPKVSRKRD